MSETKNLPEISANVLKIVAISAMFIDHLANIFIGNYYSMPLWIMHTVGRLAIPIFTYFLVEGFYRTRDVNRYMSRMLIFAAISYVPFIYFYRGYSPSVLSTDWMCFNQLFSFFFGLLFLKSLHSDGKLPERILIGIFAFIGILFCQYGIFGLGMILAFDVMHNNKKNGILAYIGVIGTFGFANGLNAFSGLFNPESLYNYLIAPGYFQKIMVNFVGYLLPLILIAMPRKQNEKRPGVVAKWFFYIFYPLHLTLLVLYEQFIYFPSFSFPK
jgi:hypothetical protein